MVLLVRKQSFSRLGDKMISSELSKNDSFYQRVCHTTDTFTCCIRVYEALLPYFEAGPPGDSISKRLFNIGGMLTILHSELTILKNEITTATAAVDGGGDDKASNPNVESKAVAQGVSEHNQQENIICEASTIEQKMSNEEKVLNKSPERNWEDVTHIPGEEYEKEKVNHEDNKIDKTISHDEKVHIKPTENLKTRESDFRYICGNCNEAITVYNQDLHLSVALHNQDGCCRGKPSKLITAQKEKQEKKGQVQNLTKSQEGSNRVNLTPPQLGEQYKTREFSCIQPLEKGFICTVCHKKLPSPKNFAEHVRGSYHKNFLSVPGKEVQKNTGHMPSVASALTQLFKTFENQSPTSAKQKESIPSVDVQLSKIIKHLSGSLYSQMQYLSVGKGAIVCNLCVCPIPPTVKNVRDHVLGSRHSKNETAFQAQTKDCISNNN
ncbi:uncharacterized protein LOC124556554 isoform X1 [Schistocerca americana]|uniref:uncharacterized protein LOC124556554 isoform X1 n=2 Tax=Schistocerca americana TaxID=7009 RepID=UPI001F4F762B|nr:uncharacterized protein LOC124556554 isoform X1 [Schistocerca americana]XP_046986568.1 uncharacterized protein LOC124556554 isoform X1 [Schistocerca americana]